MVKKMTPAKKKAFKINAKVAKEDGVRALLPEIAYVKKLIEDGEALYVDNVLIDAPQIIEQMLNN